MKLYSVIFKDNGKGYYFINKDELSVGSNVIVETERGIQYGKINNVIGDTEDIDKYKSIIRVANKEDKRNFENIQKENYEALNKCKSLIKKMNLKMNVISADFTFDKSQLMFSFVADERIDFRDLAKKLASIYHTRIELRQIGARDKAKEIGGIGVCGQKLCCTRFLNHIEAISMNMAKNQNLALNPTKINGLCGRLLCCLEYEDDNYVTCAKGLPNVGDDIKTATGIGKVISVDVLNRKCKALVGSIKEEIDFSKNENNDKK